MEQCLLRLLQSMLRGIEMCLAKAATFVYIQYSVFSLFYDMPCCAVFQKLLHCKAVPHAAMSFICINKLLLKDT